MASPEPTHTLVGDLGWLEYAIADYIAKWGEHWTGRPYLGEFGPNIPGMPTAMANMAMTVIRKNLADVDRPAGGPTTDDLAELRLGSINRAAANLRLLAPMVSDNNLPPSHERRDGWVDEMRRAADLLNDYSERPRARPTREQIVEAIGNARADLGTDTIGDCIAPEWLRAAADAVMALYDQPDPGMPTKAETDVLAEAILANARAKEAADHDEACEREWVTSKWGGGWTACQCSTHRTEDT
jgi:hypothetical protein